MWEEILRAIPVFLSSMVKFILGPIGGYAAGLTLTTTILTTVAGMMTSVLAFTFFGDWLRDKVFHRLMKNRHSPDRFKRFSGIWKKYGIAGVAILTPIILTPIGGTLLAVSMGTPRDKLIFYMFLSAAFWSVAFSSAIYFFGNEILPDFIK
jgi:membrane protein DedA with SNARE-associated domain